MEYQNLSVDELQNQIEQQKQKQAELEKALNQRWQAEKTELAQEIRRMIDERGYEIEEIVGHVMPRRRRGGGKKSSGSYTRYVDPDNPQNVYVRGVLPRWLKQKMTERGYDPSSKEQREQFKANYLHAVQD